MPAVETIERVFASGLLDPSRGACAETGADDSDIDAEAMTLGCAMSSALRAVLRRWNGLDFEVLRIHSVAGAPRRFRRMSAWQPTLDELPAGTYAFGSDPAGFAYLEAPDGRIYGWDHDGGEIELLAPTFDCFICEHVFGSKSESFLGPDWAAAVRTKLG